MKCAILADSNNGLHRRGSRCQKSDSDYFRFDCDLCTASLFAFHQSHLKVIIIIWRKICVIIRPAAGTLVLRQRDRFLESRKCVLCPERWGKLVMKLIIWMTTLSLEQARKLEQGENCRQCRVQLSEPRRHSSRQRRVRMSKTLQIERLLVELFEKSQNKRERERKKVDWNTQ